LLDLFVKQELVPFFFVFAVFLPAQNYCLKEFLVYIFGLDNMTIITNQMMMEKRLTLKLNHVVFLSYNLSY